MEGSIEPAPTARQLAGRSDFQLGATLVSPSTRSLRGPVGAAVVEPKVMLVLLRLADAGGAVVTRAQLVEDCWRGRFVGDDAVNRAIAEVRRGIRATVHEIDVETIPRIGWRLTGADSAELAEIAAAARVADKRVGRLADVAALAVPSRRRLIAGSGAAVLAAGCVAALRRWPDPDQRRADALVDRAAVAMRDDDLRSPLDPVALLREAVRIAPDRAEAWGRLALALARTVGHDPDLIDQGEADTAAAAERALRLDPGQADAQVALAILTPSFGDWLASEQRLRAVLILHPRSRAANEELANLMANTGRLREAERRRRWLAAEEPMSPAYAATEVLSLWSVGRRAEMDTLADRARRLWPRHPGVWFARMYTLGFSGRPAAAVDMIETPGSPAEGPPGTPSMRLATFRALAGRGSVMAAIEAARSAAQSGSGAYQAIPMLSAVGALDLAFGVAEGALLRRGAMRPRLWGRSEPTPKQARYRYTTALFSPAAAAMRADSRFLPLMRDIGLADYWRASGRPPDFLGSRAPSV